MQYTSATMHHTSFGANSPWKILGGEIDWKQICYKAIGVTEGRKGGREEKRRKKGGVMENGGICSSTFRTDRRPWLYTVRRDRKTENKTCLEERQLIIQCICLYIQAALNVQRFVYNVPWVPKTSQPRTGPRSVYPFLKSVAATDRLTDDRQCTCLIYAQMRKG